MLKKIICLLLLLPALAQAAAFVEGRDYLVVSNPTASTSANKKPLITEFFSYGCPWCYKLESPLQAWLHTANNNTQLDRVPVVFKPEWTLYAKAYYTAHLLALGEKLNPLLFKSIQEDKKTLDNQQAMIAFFVSQGVDKEIAKSAFEHSPTVDMNVNNGMALMANYQINAIPAFVVNNHYKTDLQMAKSPERLFALLTFLINKG